MRYRHLFILFIILITASVSSMAADRYRVEVLVLQHLNSVEEAKVLSGIRDYSAALDFLTPEPEEAGSLAKGCEPETPPLEETLQAEEELLAEEEPDPNAVVHVPEMGPEMQDAWRRLRLSGPFRPLQFLAWEQGSEAPFPELRIHDGQVVFVDDPYADLRELDMYGDTSPAERADGDTDCVEPEADPFPKPTLYYALDGTVSLKRSRFLHLNLDLQMREALVETELLTPDESGLPPGGGRTGARPPESAAGASDQPTEFAVHGLEQSRQVRSSRMEYFDGPVIGVLAWVTTIPLEDSDER